MAVDLETLSHIIIPPLNYLKVIKLERSSRSRAYMAYLK